MKQIRHLFRALVFSPLLLACTETDPGETYVPTPPGIFAAGKPARFLGYSVARETGAVTLDSGFLEIKEVGRAGDSVTYEERNSLSYPFDTLPRRYTFRLSDRALVTGDTAVQAWPAVRTWLLETRDLNLEGLLTGERHDFDGIYPLTAKGHSPQGYGENLVIGGRNYSKVAFECRLPKLPDVGTSCNFYSEEGLLIRSLGYGGNAVPAAGYVDLEP